MSTYNPAISYISPFSFLFFSILYSFSQNSYEGFNKNNFFFFFESLIAISISPCIAEISHFTQQQQKIKELKQILKWILKLVALIELLLIYIKYLFIYLRPRKYKRRTKLNCCKLRFPRIYKSYKQNISLIT